MGIIADANLAAHELNTKLQEMLRLVTVASEDKFSNEFISKNFTAAEKTQLLADYEVMKTEMVAIFQTFP